MSENPGSLPDPSSVPRTPGETEAPRGPEADVSDRVAASRNQPAADLVAGDLPLDESVGVMPEPQDLTASADGNAGIPTPDDAVSGGEDGTNADEDGPVEDEDGPVEEEDDHADPLDTEGEIAADYLEELLDIADLDGDIDTYAENGRAHVSVVTETDTLVGEHGEILDALQELARLAVMTETGNRSRLMLDIAGHRDRRRKELQGLAADAIEEVKTSGEPVRLSSMNPFERKIVHDCVADAGLTSESEGEEPRRRVVVQPVR